MTPAARIAAAIEILDLVIGGAAAERVLTTWARQNRFAGSGDRAALRDHVFDALRRLHSAAAAGGAMTGRAVMLGLLRQQGIDPDVFFTGLGHAPAPLISGERAARPPATPDQMLDCPDWLAPLLRTDLGADFPAIMALLQTRAPVFLRVNIARTTLGQAQAALAAEEIETRPVPLSPTALEVLSNPRRIQQSAPYTTGLVELQDAASQAISDAVPLAPGQRVLDLCAGGGGKTLALAARCPTASFCAHDIDPARMSDLPARAGRAGVSVQMLSPDTLPRSGLFDVVVVDAPCSGSGAWRRGPQGKWLLTPERLTQLGDIQSGVLAQAGRYVAPGGVLAYMTCSLISAENCAQVDRFLTDRSDWRLSARKNLTPLDGGDGFFLAILGRS